jgi:hypothetical protein
MPGETVQHVDIRRRERNVQHHRAVDRQDSKGEERAAFALAGGEVHNGGLVGVAGQLETQAGLIDAR